MIWHSICIFLLSSWYDTRHHILIIEILYLKIFHWRYVWGSGYKKWVAAIWSGEYLETTTSIKYKWEAEKKKPSIRRERGPPSWRKPGGGKWSGSRGGSGGSGGSTPGLCWSLARSWSPSPLPWGRQSMMWGLEEEPYKTQLMMMLTQVNSGSARLVPNRGSRWGVRFKICYWRHKDTAQGISCLCLYCIARRNIFQA